MGEWKVKLPPEVEARVLGQWDRNKEWPIPRAAKYLEILPWQVYKLIYGGILHARRAKIGRRDRLLISEEEVCRLKQHPPGSKQFKVDA